MGWFLTPEKASMARGSEDVLTAICADLVETYGLPGLQALALACGFDFPDLQRLLLGEKISSAKAWRLAAATGVPLSWWTITSNSIRQKMAH
jgi:hypothetical protein